jgi:hypothetical protein
MMSPELEALAREAGFDIHKPNSSESWEPFVGIGGYGETSDVTAQLQRFYELAQARKMPEGWVPMRLEWEPGYPEDVAFGPQIMMDRLKKWLDRYFASKSAGRLIEPKSGDGWNVVWWNEHLRAMVPDGMEVSRCHMFGNGTMIVGFKRSATRAAAATAQHIAEG